MGKYEQSEEEASTPIGGGTTQAQSGEEPKVEGEATSAVASGEGPTEQIPTRPAPQTAEGSADLVDGQDALCAAVRRLIEFSHSLVADPREVRAALPELESIHRELYYHSTYGANRGRTFVPLYQRPEAVRCAVEGCEAPFPYFNIEATRSSYNWRCLTHIPPDITFPIGMNSEEWIASGRKKA